MNPTMKRTLRIAGLAVLLVLILCLTAQAADAASYKRITLEEDWDNQRVKVGNRYFWMEGDDLQISVNGGAVLYSSTSREGTGKEIFRIEDLSTFNRINGVMVTDGSKIYFAVSDGQNDVIYSSNADGTKLKKIKTLKPTESERESTYMPYYEMVSVYNGRLYVAKRSSLDPAHHCLRSINLETGKITTHVKNCDVQWTSGSSRYIYYKKHNGGGPNDTTLRVYDSKKKKNYTVTTTLGAGAIGTYDGKMYYYKNVTGDDGIPRMKVYRCTYTGKEDKLVFTLKYGSYNFRSGSRIYCTASGEYFTPCYYSLKSGKMYNIYQEELISAHTKWQNAGAN